VRASKLRLAFMNLNGDISEDELLGYFDKNTALRILQNITGQDFGYDIEAWRTWINENRPNELLDNKKNRQISDLGSSDYDSEFAPWWCRKLFEC
jgi:hypothetical protein